MKYLFFGTPEFAAIILEKLIKSDFPPAGVVCNPDRPVGRKKVITPPPTKVLALKNNIPVFQPENLLDSKFQILVSGFDFAVVAAYAKIIPLGVIRAFPKGVIGIHPSLLPKYRGATPIQSVILAGEKETGVTLYLLDEKVDHGNVIIQKSLVIADSDNYVVLEKRLAELAATLIVETLPKFIEEELKPMSQDENQTTFTKKFATEDACVDLTKDDPIEMERKIRALNPEPGVFTLSSSKGGPVRMKILEAEIRDGKLALKKIQYEGKKPQAV